METSPAFTFSNISDVVWGDCPFKNNQTKKMLKCSAIKTTVGSAKRKSTLAVVLLCKHDQKLWEDYLENNVADVAKILSENDIKVTKENDPLFHSLTRVYIEDYNKKIENQKAIEKSQTTDSNAVKKAKDAKTAKTAKAPKKSEKKSKVHAEETETVVPDQPAPKIAAAPVPTSKIGKPKNATTKKAAATSAKEKKKESKEEEEPESKGEDTPNEERKEPSKKKKGESKKSSAKEIKETEETKANESQTSDESASETKPKNEKKRKNPKKEERKAKKAKKTEIEEDPYDNIPTTPGTSSAPDTPSTAFMGMTLDSDKEDRNNREELAEENNDTRTSNISDKEDEGVVEQTTNMDLEPSNSVQQKETPLNDETDAKINEFIRSIVPNAMEMEEPKKESAIIDESQKSKLVEELEKIPEEVLFEPTEVQQIAPNVANVTPVVNEEKNQSISEENKGKSKVEPEQVLKESQEWKSNHYDDVKEGQSNSNTTTTNEKEKPESLEKIAAMKKIEKKAEEPKQICDICGSGSIDSTLVSEMTNCEEIGCKKFVHAMSCSMLSLCREHTSRIEKSKIEVEVKPDEVYTSRKERVVAPVDKNSEEMRQVYTSRANGAKSPSLDSRLSLSNKKSNTTTTSSTSKTEKVIEKTTESSKKESKVVTETPKSGNTSDASQIVRVSYAMKNLFVKRQYLTTSEDAVSIALLERVITDYGESLDELKKHAQNISTVVADQYLKFVKAGGNLPGFEASSETEKIKLLSRASDFGVIRQKWSSLLGMIKNNDVGFSVNKDADLDVLVPGLLAHCKQIYSHYQELSREIAIIAGDENTPKKTSELKDILKTFFSEFEKQSTEIKIFNTEINNLRRDLLAKNSEISKLRSIANSEPSQNQELQKKYDELVDLYGKTKEFLASSNDTQAIQDQVVNKLKEEVSKLAKSNDTLKLENEKIKQEMEIKLKEELSKLTRSNEILKAENEKIKQEMVIKQKEHDTTMEMHFNTIKKLEELKKNAEESKIQEIAKLTDGQTKINEEHLTLVNQAKVLISENQRKDAEIQRKDHIISKFVENENKFSKFLVDADNETIARSEQTSLQLNKLQALYTSVAELAGRGFGIERTLFVALQSFAVSKDILSTTENEAQFANSIMTHPWTQDPNTHTYSEGSSDGFMNSSFLGDHTADVQNYLS